jgi:hypothetical protein
MRCPGSVALSHGTPDNSSVYADEGTAGHTVAAECLRQGIEADSFIGQTINVYEDDGTTVRRSFVIDPDYAGHIQVYVDAVRRTVGTKLFEQRVDYSEFIGIPNSNGTGDAVVMDESTLTLESHDAKFGKGVKVYASWVDDFGVTHPNEQLALYLLGALSDNDIIADWQNFKLAVHQPRIGGDGHYDEHTMTRAELMAFAQSARAAAAEALSGFEEASVALYLEGGGKDRSVLKPLPVTELLKRGMLNPGAKQCQFCPAAEAGLCPKLEREVRRIARVADDADFGPPVAPDAVSLADLPSAAELSLIELWVSGIRSRIQRELQQGIKLKHWKLVKGKKGARQWVKEKMAEAEKAMKKLLGKAAYTEPELLSPTQAESTLKKLKRKAEYAKLTDYITQADGGEHVAPMDDDRPAIEKANVELLLDVDGDII